MGPLSLQGYWWLPESPDEKQSGSLKFDQIEGARLSVVGRLASQKTESNILNETPNVIHGFTTTGKPVTLINAFVTESRFRSPGIATETWFINLVGIGAHFTNSDEALFRRSWVRFDGIAQLLAHRPFVVTSDLDSRTVQLTVHNPARGDVGRIVDASVYTGSSFTGGQEGEERWAAKSEALIALDADAPQSLNWHLSASSRLKALAELLYGRPLHQIRLIVELPRQPIEDEYPPHIEVEIHARMIGGDEKLPPINRPPMITLPGLLAAAPNALANWFEQYDTLSAALHLLSTVASDRRMFPSVRFLLATQAIETFHREACPEAIIPASEYEAIVTALIAAIPSTAERKIRDKLILSLKYANEPSLRQRLRSLIIIARDERDAALPSYDNDFVSAVVATRNYSTHHGERPENLLVGAGMHYASRRLVVLLTALFLRRLGLTSAEIDSVIASHQEFHPLWTTKGLP
jgi:ApeA N-terminal domain 1